MIKKVIRNTATRIGILATVTLTLLPLSASAKGKADIPQYAGALTFSPDGTLFVGDNVSSAVFAYKTGQDKPQPIDPKAPLQVVSVDVQISQAMKGKPGKIEINGLAVHPTSHEVYLSVSRINNGTTSPAVVKVSSSGKISAFDLNATDRSEFAITDAPTLDEHFADRAAQAPVPGPEKYHAKARTSMRSMTIVDMKFHNGELFIAGISNEEFASTLRRVPYPFTDKVSETKVKIYHDAHSQWETRAPIRAMTFANVDGKDTLVAAYTCSPLVLIPIEDLKNGAQVEGHVIGDMGNGQPLSMFAFKYNGQDSLFVTNISHDPRVIPIADLQHAKVYTEAMSAHRFISDTTGLPAGVVGHAVMFVGSSLHADSLNDNFIVSLTRYASSGELVLEMLPAFPLPGRLDEVWSEFDFASLKTK